MNNSESVTTFLSIITICKNNLLGVKKTVESILIQKNRNIEIIIIDGDSFDGTKDFLEKNKSRFAYAISESDSGIYDAQNKGIFAAKGEFILFLNAGDVLVNETTIDTLFEASQKEKTKNIGIFYSDVLLRKGNQLQKKIYKKELSPFYMCNEIINHQSQIIRTNILKENYFDLKYRLAADYELFLRLLFKKKVIYLHLDLVISIYDLSGISTTEKGIQQYQLEHSEIRQNYFPEEISRLEDLHFYQTSIEKISLFPYENNGFNQIKKLSLLLKKYPLLYRYAQSIFTFLLKLKSIFKWHSS